MKRKVCWISIIIFCFFILNGMFYSENTEMQEDISNKIIRFHVIANSDSKEDQKLKIKIKDEVLEYIKPILEKSNSIEESRNILKIQDVNIKNIVQDVIEKEGYKYNIATSLSKEKFPIKTYGNITLPSGEYEAYRIIIGDGQGQNWWCVMFPPLCFVDITKGKNSFKENESRMKKVISNEEYNKIDNSKKRDIVFKFKIIDIVKKIKELSA